MSTQTEPIDPIRLAEIMRAKTAQIGDPTARSWFAAGWSTALDVLRDDVRTSDDNDVALGLPVEPEPEPEDDDDLDLALLNLDEIVRLLVDEFGIAAEVAMTGGGCATIFAGDTYVDDNREVRHAALAGPGSYRWAGDEPSTASLREFWIGPDDDGQSGGIDAVEVGVRTERDAARLIAQQTHARPFGVALDAESIEEIGLDSTLRGGHPAGRGTKATR